MTRVQLLLTKFWLDQQNAYYNMPNIMDYIEDIPFLMHLYISSL
jgi:hypothetical protein